MYVYLTNYDGSFWLYTVGFYKPDGKWEAESDHNDSESAAARVHYLNGGSHSEISREEYREIQNFNPPC